MILIELQKAFDTIDHQILIKKMKYLRFSCLKFLQEKILFLTPPLCRLLCNALIQPVFD